MSDTTDYIQVDWNTWTPIGQPAPTPSGDEDAEVAAERWCAENDQYADPVGGFMAGAKWAESRAAAALQEARDAWRLANEAAERLLPIANRAEAAEQRLRGVESALAAASRPVPNMGEAFQHQDAMSALRYIAERYGRLDGVGWDRILPPPAAPTNEVQG